MSSAEGTAKTQITIVWVALITLTAIAYFESSYASSLLLATAVLAATITKSWLVIHYYMEIAHAPNWLKALCAAWVTAVAVMLMILVVGTG